jgi:Ser/Thr protein kinase RdoA (MazF antagonist)
MMLQPILSAYDIENPDQIETLSSGLINKTWKVTKGEKSFIVQQINHHVFKKPFEVAQNIRAIDEYLRQHAPGYLFVSPVENVDHHDIVQTADGYFRVFPFINNSHTVDVVTSPSQAFEAALQFGTFTRCLAGFDATKLHITIPDFHNLSLRYWQFEESLKNGNPERIRQSQHLIHAIQHHTPIVAEFERIRKNKEVKIRVTHHDTKISNVLFDKQGKGMCVIDLDTVMPGYFISDVGDMFRTYLSPVSEEEKDFTLIEIRDEFFRAIVRGYINGIGGELTKEEHQLILFSGQFLIYMQALRFLTDYFNNDVYYGARYDEQNFFRAGNQITLLQKIGEKAADLKSIIDDELRHATDKYRA